MIRITSRLARAALVLGIASCGISTALARTQKGDWEIGYHRGQTRFISSDDLDDTPFHGYNVGFCLTDLFELAINSDSVETESEDGREDHELEYRTLDFLINLGEDAHKPFVMVSVGRLDRTSRVQPLPGVTLRITDEMPIFELGLGYRGHLSRRIGLRFDVRLSFFDDDGDHFSMDEQDARWALGIFIN
jgi:hypothetical protein